MIIADNVPALHMLIMCELMSMVYTSMLYFIYIKVVDGFLNLGLLIFIFRNIMIISKKFLVTRLLKMYVWTL